MINLRKWIGPAAVFGLAVLVFSTSIANGQNPYDRLHRALVVQQATSNISRIGQALSNVPPYAFGVNPVVMPFPVTVPTANPYAMMYANPYASLTSNPYSTSPGYDNSGYYSPYTYSYDPYSGYLRGAADVINAQG